MRLATSLLVQLRGFVLATGAACAGLTGGVSSWRFWPQLAVFFFALGVLVVLACGVLVSTAHAGFPAAGVVAVCTGITGQAAGEPRCNTAWTFRTLDQLWANQNTDMVPVCRDAWDLSQSLGSGRKVVCLGSLYWSVPWKMPPGAHVVVGLAPHSISQSAAPCGSVSRCVRYEVETATGLYLHSSVGVVAMWPQLGMMCDPTYECSSTWSIQNAYGGGAVGPAGPAGPTGATGATGATGPAGAAGLGASVDTLYAMLIVACVLAFGLGWNSAH
jgi:hypothetical protein